MKYKAEPGTIGICAGTVDESSVEAQGLEEMVQGKAKHIFVGEKAGWYILGEDGLRRYEGLTELIGVGNEEEDNDGEKGLDREKGHDWEKGNKKV